MSPKEMPISSQSSNQPVSLPDPMRHLATFAALGPRPTGSDSERRAAQFARDTMEAMGLQVSEDRFACNPRMFRPHMMIFLGVVAMGAIPAILAFHPLAFVLAAVGCFYARKLYTDLLHNRQNIAVTALPKQANRNVIGKLAPKGAVRSRIVLMSHLDTALCSPIFSEKMVKSLKSNIMLDRILFAAMGILYLASALSGNLWPYYGAVAASLYVVGSLLVLLYSELFSPFSPGANDNGTGVAGVLTLAEALSKDPLDHTEVWFTCLGAEEPGAYGGRELYENHREELHQAYVLNLDSIGIGNLKYLTNEGYLDEYKCSTEMIEILEHISAKRPDLGLTPYAFKGWGGYTDCTHMLRNGVKATTLVASSPDGLIKNWHTVRDTIDGIEKDTFSKALETAMLLMRELDERAGA